MKFIKALTFSLLLGFSVTSFAKYIEINVNNRHQMVQDLRMIHYAQADDTVYLQVSQKRQFSKAMICRYVDALKSTKARVRLGQIPREVIRHARDCE